MDLIEKSNLKSKSKGVLKRFNKNKKPKSPHNTSSFLIKQQITRKSSPGNNCNFSSCYNSESNAPISDIYCNINNINFKESNIINNYSNNNGFKTYSLNLEHELSYTGGSMLEFFLNEDVVVNGSEEENSSFSTKFGSTEMEIDSYCYDYSDYSSNEYSTGLCEIETEENSKNNYICNKEKNTEENGYCFFRGKTC